MSRVIDGRFELVERLGGGGMGTVWRAHDLALHRDVALKEVRPPDPAMAEYDVEGARTLRARVLREARALARIDHPNVVTIHHIVDAGEGTYPWLVMELVTGGSLQDRLDRGPMTPAEAAAVGRGLLAALRAAHARDIEHRDVKPANVLLRPDGRPVLTDFGIAAIRESTVLTASGSIIGSPDYMAPERIRGGASGGPAGDLWSLGMLLYVAVEGNHPLRRENTLATLAAVLSDDVPPPLRAGGLTDVLTRLLVRDPAERPGVEELARVLGEVAAEDGEAVSREGAVAVRDAAAREADGREANGREANGREPADGGEATSFRLAPPPVAAPPATPAASPAPASSSAPVTPVPPAPATAAPTPATPPPGDPRAVTVPSAASAPPVRGADGRRRGRAGRFLGSAAVVVLAVGIPVAAMAWDWRPAEPGGGPSGAPPSQQGPAAQRPRTSTTPTPTADADPVPLDLLTPAGVRAAIASVKAASGGTKVTGFVVYPEYAVSESLVKGSTKRYDRYVYRGEDAAVRQGSGTAFPGTVPADLVAFNWDALPALLQRADKDLGVDKPTSRYVVVVPASTLAGTDAGITVYLSDAYGSAYLKADAKGRVTESHPRND
ncbi:MULTISPECIES: serine/threonine-protein kinase [unclassified Streptomyces]|uniref:serine/threonine-protein kinase n=1 Tax=unclassified Streptomyces TaxID=2593676 RepID=UPI00099E5466|nr:MULTISPECIES: serine/threonine-protein kinase [unclassified Streptomyces]